MYLIDQFGKVRQPDFQTYGADVVLIDMKLFDQHYSFSNSAFNEMQELKNSVPSTVQDYNDFMHKIYSKFGSSADRTFLLNYFIDRKPKDETGQK